MENKNLEIMKTFDEQTLPDLDVCTLGALELFSKKGIPHFDISHFKTPAVVGSGNAKVTAQILFQGKNVLFADENTFEEINGNQVDGAIIFSASGEKHAPIAVKDFQDKGIETYLVTCNSNSSAGKLLDEKHVIVTPKNREPYTYNTSTYLGWILAHSKENPEEIYDFIQEKVKPSIPDSFDKYDGFLLVTPNNLASVNQLFEVKFIELFGRRVARDVKSFEELKHAITVVPSKTELCIRFGDNDVPFENDILTIPVPKNAGPATLMAIGYYVIGQIQKQKPALFKQHIHKFIENMNKSDFGKGLKVIVD